MQFFFKQISDSLLKVLKEFGVIGVLASNRARGREEERIKRRIITLSVSGE